MENKSAAITTPELQALLKSGQDIVLLDVLPENFFNKEHIPGSVNVDGYKMDFISELEKSRIKKDTTIVVYASGSDSQASAYAVERMLRHGWSKAVDYQEGLAGWKRAGLALWTVVEPLQTDRPKSSYAVNPGESAVRWSGRNMNSIHTGTLQLKEGKIDFAGEAVAGELVIDMNSITDTDLTDPAWNQMLVAHLKSEDFFETTKYPTTKIVIKRSERLCEPANGTPNFKLTADLSIKDVTRELVFPASVLVEEDGTLKAHAHFDFDRTLWNVKYGSFKFFKLLGMHLVDDVVSLDLKIIAR